jgi:hypothetical protein
LHWRFETKNASEGETLGIYIGDEGEGEIRRGMNLFDGGEENPPRILKNRRRGALVTDRSPFVTGAGLEKKKRRMERRGMGPSHIDQNPNLDISDDF